MKLTMVALGALALAGATGVASASSAATRFGTVCSTDNGCPLSSMQAAVALGAKIQRIRLPLARNAAKFSDITAAKAGGYDVQLNLPDNCDSATDAAWLASVTVLLEKAIATGVTIVAVALGNEPDSEANCSAVAYLANLKSFVGIVHARGLRATDGGVSYSGIMLAYSGSPAPGSPAALRKQKVIDIHAGLAATGEDWPNAHYYGPAAQMVQVVTWWAAGRTPVINEMGSRTLDATETAGLVAGAKALGAPFAIALVGQGQGAGGAMGLVDSTGKTNVNGAAFRTTVAVSP